MLTVQQLRDVLARDPSADNQYPVLVAAFDRDGMGTVYEVEEATSNNGHLQLVITLSGRWKRRRASWEDDPYV